MKMTKCDRCGKISTVNPTTKNLEFPIIHITKADDIFQSVTPREIDLCRECRKELDGWLKKKPLAVMREKIREDMKESTEFSRIIDETVKKMAEEETKTMVRPVPCRDKKTDDGLSAILTSFLLNIFGGVNSNNPAMKLMERQAEKGKSTSFAAIELLDDLLSAFHKGIEDMYHLREEAVRRAAAADGKTE